MTEPIDVWDCAAANHDGCPSDMCICNCHDDYPDYDFDADPGPSIVTVELPGVSR